MDKEKLEKVKSVIRDVPDFPSKGILFRDLTTVFKDGEAPMPTTAPPYT